jgi:hypothetical protein
VLWVAYATHSTLKPVSTQYDVAVIHDDEDDDDDDDDDVFS